jgi:hypothetical protein
MLNPSTADAEQDDPTIRRCIGFAKAWGFGGIAVRNIFALRATDPRELYKSDDPVGPGNDEAICDLAGLCPLIVAAWGVHGGLRNRGRQVCELLAGAGAEVVCLGVTKDGHPKHPLYVAADAERMPFGG